MLAKKCILVLCSFMLAACASDAKFLGYTLWGGSSYYARGSTIKVQKGDTLYSIANRYDVALRSLIETNRLSPPYTLRIGQTLRLPKANYHIVQKGDTLYSISRQYNVDMPKLSAENKLSAPFTLHLGQKLFIPDSIYSKAPQKATSNIVFSKPTVTEKASSSNKTTMQYAYTQPSLKRKNKFAWPVKGQVASKFGPIAKGRNNDGINIKAPLGTAVKAADDGTVAYAGNELKGFGNLILIKHNDGWVTAYAHNQALKVAKGQKIQRGQTIATVGKTGGVSYPQLHFETRAGKKALNPLAYLQ